MKDLFVSYELAKKFKELGFDEPCFLSYRNSDGEEQLIPTGMPKPCKNSDLFITSNSDNCTAPLYQQVTDWLRKTYNIDIVIELAFSNHPAHHDGKWHYEGYEVTVWKNQEVAKDLTANNFIDYYIALNYAIKEVIMLIDNA